MARSACDSKRAASPPIAKGGTGGRTQSGPGPGAAGQGIAAPWAPVHLLPEHRPSPHDRIPGFFLAPYVRLRLTDKEPSGALLGMRFGTGRLTAYKAQGCAPKLIDRLAPDIKANAPERSDYSPKNGPAAKLVGSLITNSWSMPVHVPAGVGIASHLLFPKA